MKNFLIFIFFLGTAALFRVNAQKYTPAQHTILKNDSLISKISLTDPDKAIKQASKNLLDAEKLEFDEGKLKIYETLSYAYYAAGDFQKLIEFSGLEEKMALRLKNYLLVCNALRYQAIGYSKLGFSDEARESMKNAFRYTHKISDKQKYHKIRGLLYQASCYVEENIVTDKDQTYYDSVFVWRKKEMSELRKAKVEEFVLTGTYINIGNSYSQKNKYDSAAYYFKRSLVIAQKRKDKFSEARALVQLGVLYSGMKEHIKAIDVFEKALKANNRTDPYLDKDIYYNLIKCYKSTNNTVKYQKYLEKSVILQDSLDLLERAEVKTTITQIKKRKEESFSETKLKLYIIILSSVLLAVACLYLAYRYFKIYKKERKEKKFKEETILEKDTQLNHLESKINNAFEEVLELAKNDDPAFLARFKEVYPEFYCKLTSAYPDLTISQLRFCAMLKLNFSTKEIAHYHHTTVRGVQTKKTRLRKQLNLSSEEDLNKWMMNFS
ncbi:tetratricopeptide repeat protein [Chryseobacterium sp. PBS4-4]|uniref:Tetratricopeptide repeat protein n=1 Tax=Chryseobacterium edaphi TaxID=2976532 RepID=A0ABT2W3J8_9FLAO|nr:tetratricopeptide repeat protein [Chryseobacterium edaphi]MCU7615812.1 tetratricopeptide repeat protein [Chryseobacterium edaphi]